MDVIAPHLTLAERAVWLIMFRHARGGTCETTVRMLAAGAGIGRATAERALRELTKAGLVRAVWKSCDKSKASKYAMHPHPHQCLGNLRTTE
jgi:DNA-binding transcriptional regulator YhcF (GntR family)